METEIWKDIVGYEGLYQVSNLGRVKSLGNGKSNSAKYERILKPSNDKDGYKQVGLFLSGKQKTHRIHKLVCLNFIGIDFEKPHINHIDGDKTNNKLNNLEWITNIDNIRHSWKLGLSNNNHLKIKINQFDLDGNFIKQWDSIIEAGKFFGKNHKNISKCINKINKTAYGFIWNKTEQDENNN